jgi:hypothetical protein
MRIKSLLLLFILFCAPYLTHACRCHSQSVSEVYDKAALIIKGTILKIERTQQLYTMTYRIEKLYKGEVADSLVIISTSTSSCGLTRGISKGQTHIIFSEKKGAIYFAHQCIQPGGYFIEENELEAALKKKTLRKEKKS